MATFKEQMTVDLEQTFFDSDVFATFAIFSPTTGSSMGCEIIIDHDVLMQPDGYNTEVVTLGTTIDAKISQVGTPGIGDRFITDEKIYVVKRIDSNDGTIVKVVVK